MMLRKMRGMNGKTDGLARGIRRMRVSPTDATQRKARDPKVVHSNGVLEESVTELGDLVQKIGNIKLEKNSAATIQPSIAEESENSMSDGSGSVMDISEEPTTSQAALFSTAANNDNTPAETSPSTSQPTASTSQPTASTSQPTASTSQPTTSTSQASTSNSQPSTSGSRPSGSRGSQRPFFDVSSPAMDISDEPGSTQVPLSTTLSVTVTVDNTATPIRALLDSASQLHLITDRCRRKLQLPLVSANTKLYSLGQNEKQVLGRTIVSFSPYFNNKRTYKLEAIVVDQICPYLPTKKVHPSIKEQLDFFRLADPDFDIPGPIELLIGSDLFSVLMKGGQCFVLGRYCCAFQSSAGWVVAGQAPIDDHQPKKLRTRYSG